MQPLPASTQSHISRSPCRYQLLGLAAPTQSPCPQNMQLRPTESHICHPAHWYWPLGVVAVTQPPPSHWLKLQPMNRISPSGREAYVYPGFELWGSMATHPEYSGLIETTPRPFLWIVSASRFLEHTHWVIFKYHRGVPWTLYISWSTRIADLVELTFEWIFPARRDYYGLILMWGRHKSVSWSQ